MAEIIAPDVLVTLIDGRMTIVVDNTWSIEPASLYADTWQRGCMVDDVRRAAHMEGFEGVRAYMRETGFRMIRLREREIAALPVCSE